MWIGRKLYIEREDVWKVIVFLVVFLIFLCLFILLIKANMSLQTHTLDAVYDSYRIENKVGRYGSRKFFISVIDSNGLCNEYKIPSVYLSEFDEKEFKENARSGDHIWLTLDKNGSVLEVEVNGHAYLSLDETKEKSHNNSALGYCIYGLFCISSLIGIFSFVRTKRGYYKRRRYKC